MDHTPANASGKKSAGAKSKDGSKGAGSKLGSVAAKMGLKSGAGAKKNPKHIVSMTTLIGRGECNRGASFASSDGGTPDTLLSVGEFLYNGGGFAGAGEPNPAAAPGETRSERLRRAVNTSSVLR